MTIEQQIKAVKDALAEKNKAFAARMAEPIEKGVTPDEEQETAIQAIEAEIEVLEKNLKRLEKLKESAEKAAQTAVPAQGQTPAVLWPARSGFDSCLSHRISCVYHHRWLYRRPGSEE